MERNVGDYKGERDGGHGKSSGRWRFERADSARYRPLMKSVWDLVWNAAGKPRCDRFDAGGEYIEKGAAGEGWRRTDLAPRA